MKTEAHAEAPKLRRLLRLAAALPALLLVGCVAGGLPDFDGDGIADALDCGPEDPDVYTGAPDIAGEGVDQNCDGVDGVDLDRDGFASTDSGGTDCNDDDATTHPTAPEVPDDGRDQDCDGSDLLCDADGDGFRSASPGCDGQDCNDLDEDWKPGAPDPVGDGEDTNCDGIDGLDLDGDGVLSGLQGGPDCDDEDEDSYPGAPEVCDDGVDQDCSGADLPADQDQDGFDSEHCGGADCDDLAPGTHPGAIDLCNDVDEDCDGILNTTGDSDGDGFCLDDCDDADPARFPGNWDEVEGDGIDSSCDGHDGLLLSSVSTTLVGLNPNEGFGIAVASGDFDGDGLADLAVGAPGATWGEAGRVELYRGIDLLGTTPAPWITLDGDADRIGETVALADVTGDGRDDLLIGGGQHDDGTGMGIGHLLVIEADALAASGTFLAASVALTEILGDVAFGYGLGWPDRLVDLGDLDGDGRDDVLSVAFMSSAFCGQHWILTGETLAGGGTVEADAVASWEHIECQDCTYPEAIGDLDGDGRSEVLTACGDVTATGDLEGWATIWSGGLLDTAQPEPLTTISATEQVAFGRVSARSADFDGDGQREVPIGRTWNVAPATTVGFDIFAAAGLLSGATRSPADAAASVSWERTVWGNLHFEPQGLRQARGMLSPGDAFGSSHPDLLALVGTWIGADEPAALYRFSGEDYPSWTFPPPGPRLLLGEDRTWGDLKSLGDLNGDGRPEIVVGVLDAMEPFPGEVHIVWSGP